jgi:predicted 3-demethylubiquinone-9 3-methyltransferase (glyoxalase superfamily)
MQKISPFLWFDTNAEEAANFYTSIFKNSEITGVSRYGEGGPMPAGTAMVVTFELEGQHFMALNGGPHYTFNEAVSFMVHCETQDEIDHYWSKLGEGGQEIQCGWLKDKYGVTWQITPTVLGDLLQGPDPEGSKRAMMAMMQMVKLDIAALQRAYNGE